jgi:hypothetical protein
MSKKCIMVDSETYDLINHDCREELLRHHPELIKTNITLNKILYHTARYYADQ